MLKFTEAEEVLIAKLTDEFFAKLYGQSVAVAIMVAGKVVEEAVARQWGRERANQLCETIIGEFRKFAEEEVVK
jgi:hypothetical protein